MAQHKLQNLAVGAGTQCSAEQESNYDAVYAHNFYQHDPAPLVNVVSPSDPGDLGYLCQKNTHGVKAIHASLIGLQVAMCTLQLEGKEYQQVHGLPHDPAEEAWVLVGQLPLCLSDSEALMELLCGIISHKCGERVTVSRCEPVVIQKKDARGVVKEYFRGCAHFLVSNADALLALNRTILVEPDYVYFAEGAQQRDQMVKYLEGFRTRLDNSKLRPPTPRFCMTFQLAKNPPR